MGRKIRLWITAFFMLATLISLSLFFTSKQKTYSDQSIQIFAEKLKKNLIQFLQKNKNTALEVKKDFSEISRKKLSPEFMEKYAFKKLKNNPEIQGIIVFGTKFHFLFARNNRTWIATYDTLLTDTLTNWVRLNDHLQVLGKWTDTYNYFIDEKSLETRSSSLKASDNLPLWKVLINKGTQHKDFLLSSYRFYLKDNTPLSFVFVYDLHLEKSNFLTSEADHPILNFITNTEKFTLPFYFSDTGVVLLQQKPVTQQIMKLLNEWKKSLGTGDHSYLFIQNGKRYWMHVALLPPSLGIKAVSITTTEDALKNIQRSQSSVFGYAAFVFGMLALIGLLSFKNKQKKPASKSNEDITKVISLGENDKTEFKSSLRWDYREQKVNPVLETVILKSIAAFANAQGGTLIIGVDDEGRVLGLTPDFQSLKKKNADGFELHLRRLIKNQFGISFATAHLQINFYEIEGKTICVINITPSHHPLYLKTKNKNGNETEKFYVRMGNASQEISSLREIQQYIQMRFK